MLKPADIRVGIPTLIGLVISSATIGAVFLDKIGYSGLLYLILFEFRAASALIWSKMYSFLPFEFQYNHLALTFYATLIWQVASWSVLQERGRIFFGDDSYEFSFSSLNSVEKILFILSCLSVTLFIHAFSMWHYIFSTIGVLVLVFISGWIHLSIHEGNNFDQKFGSILMIVFIAFLNWMLNGFNIYNFVEGLGMYKIFEFPLKYLVIIFSPPHFIDAIVGGFTVLLLILAAISFRPFWIVSLFISVLAADYIYENGAESLNSTLQDINKFNDSNDVFTP